MKYNHTVQAIFHFYYRDWFTFSLAFFIQCTLQVIKGVKAKCLLYLANNDSNFKNPQFEDGIGT